MTTPDRTRNIPDGTRGFYAVAAIGTIISANTSWRFFADVLLIDGKLERGSMFAIIELTFLACGLAMRAGVRSAAARPGPARILAWAMCAVGAYMAWAQAGPVAGTARVILGPVIAVVATHLALGIEIRARHGQGTGHEIWSQIGPELRERTLSRFGLGRVLRPAAEQSRDRATDRAARLATARWVGFRRARLARAVRASGVALDPGRRVRLRGQLAAYRHLDELCRLDLPSPWLDEETPQQDLATPAPAISGQVATPVLAISGQPQDITRPSPLATVMAMLADNPMLTADTVAAVTGKSGRSARRYLAEARAAGPTQINGCDLDPETEQQ